MRKDFSLLEKKLGFSFKNKDILAQALVHRSFLNEHPSFHIGHNERLEFLGDAVLELIVTQHLYKTLPDMAEGDMTNIRASLVNSQMLAETGKEIGLDKFLFLSKGETKDTNKKAKQYILANAFEAVIGALFLDLGYDCAKKFVAVHLLSKLQYILDNSLYHDPKTQFQEISQEKENITPSYKVIEESGPDHAKHFVIGAYLNDHLIATGSGTSKQEAQMRSAENALKAKQWSTRQN